MLCCNITRCTEAGRHGQVSVKQLIKLTINKTMMKATMVSYMLPLCVISHTHLTGLLDPSLISYTKNPKNKAKRRGFLKSLFR